MEQSERARKLRHRLKAGGAVVCDGGMGTELIARGLKIPGDCPELWNAERPDDVRAIAESYFAAGAELTATNTFGGSPVRLAAFGLANRATELNRRAAELAREAAGTGRWVAGSIGPSAWQLNKGAAFDREALMKSFAEQAAALAEGGADLLLVESMSDLQEALCGLKAAKSVCDLPVAVSFSFENLEGAGFATRWHKLRPKEAARAVEQAGADIVGHNCGGGPEEAVEIVRQLRAATALPILAEPNAGLPQAEGEGFSYPWTPERFASFVPALIEAGAQLIGGCCGAGPEHVKAIRAALVNGGRA